MKLQLYEALCDPTLSVEDRFKAAKLTKWEALQLYDDPGFLDEYFDECKKRILGPVLPDILYRLGEASRSGSVNHMKLFFQLLGKLTPDSENHLHIQFGNMSDTQLEKRLEQLGRESRKLLDGNRSSD